MQKIKNKYIWTFYKRAQVRYAPVIKLTITTRYDEQLIKMKNFF